MGDGNIGFIGGGNMGASLIGGLVADGTPPDTIWVSDPDTPKLDDLTRRFGVNAGRDNDSVASCCATVVLAVKPQIMHTVVQDLAPVLRTLRPLLVSIAAGVREAHINHWAGGGMAIVRTMPNTPALVGCGATALFANEKVDPGQRERAEAILRAVGITIWVDDEAQLDAVTALSGSGPAYYFLLMEIMQATGEAMGLDAEAARRLTLADRARRGPHRQRERRAPRGAQGAGDLARRHHRARAPHDARRRHRQGRGGRNPGCAAAVDRARGCLRKD